MLTKYKGYGRIKVIDTPKIQPFRSFDYGGFRMNREMFRKPFLARLQGSGEDVPETWILRQPIEITIWKIYHTTFIPCEMFEKRLSITRSVV